MAMTFIRLGYGTPADGVYPSFIDLAYPVWQLKDGAGYLVHIDRRLAKTPVYRGTLVQGLGKLPKEHDIQLLYRPHLRPFTQGVMPLPWDAVLETIEEELLKQECGLYWGERFRGRFLLADFTWAPRNVGYPTDTPRATGAFFGREVDVNLKITRLLDD